MKRGRCFIQVHKDTIILVQFHIQCIASTESQPLFVEQKIQAVLELIKDDILNHLLEVQEKVNSKSFKFQSCCIKRGGLSISYQFRRNLAKDIMLIPNNQKVAIGVEAAQATYPKAISIFRERLVVIAKQADVDASSYPVEVPLGKRNDASKYFCRSPHKATMSAKRKKTALSKMKKKALVKAGEEFSNEQISEDAKMSVPEETTSQNIAEICQKFAYSRQMSKRKDFDGVLANANKDEVIEIDNYDEVCMDKISSTADLSACQIRSLVRNMERELRDIFEGKVSSERHQTYKKGGANRARLAFDFQYDDFSEEQQECITDTLRQMFCYKHTKYFDYILKVLVPETMTRIMRLVNNNQVL